MSRPGSNWERLQKQMGKAVPKTTKKKTKPAKAVAAAPEIAAAPVEEKIENKLERFSHQNKRNLAEILAFDDTHMLENTSKPSQITEFKTKIGNFLAMDCEFVGTGPSGSVSELGRVSIVNYYGVIIYDVFVKPRERVTDFRTKYSGITAKHLQDAVPFADAQKRVNDLLKGKTLVGHGIKNDLKVLFLSFPRSHVIDTQVLQRFKADQRIKGKPGLKKVMDLYMGLKIQGGSHDSVEDARSTMFIFRCFKQEFLGEKRR